MFLLMRHGRTMASRSIPILTWTRRLPRGFRDVYEIGRQWRGEHVFDIFAPAPKMLLTRDRIFEIRERVGARGEIIEPLVAEDVRLAVSKLAACGIEAVAVCFLFAYANPAHEKAAAEIIR